MDATLNLTTLPKTEDEARALLETIRWGKGCVNAACPHCGTMDPYRLTAKAGSSRPVRNGVWKCRACRKQFSVTVGTVFEASHVPLVKWWLAIHLLASSKKGISAHQLHRNLRVSYQTAWFMAHRLRYAMMQGPMLELFKGIVEIDETYIGGKRRGGKKGRPGPDSHKTPVVALVERGTGRVRAFPMPRVTSDTLKAAVFAHVERDATLNTDDFFPYRQVGAEMGRHAVVKHTAKEYVRGADYTNTVEGFFGLLKRGINGVYHHVGRGHLNRYCDEFAFRYENRKISDGERAGLLVQGGDGKRLTYKMPATPGTLTA